MDQITKLFDQMEQELKDRLRFDKNTGFWYDDDDNSYTEEGISLVVYEDFKDTIGIIFNSRC